MDGRFDLRVPQHTNPQWYNALSIAIEQLHREEAEEKSRADEVSTCQRFQAAGVILLAQAVTSMLGEKPAAAARELSDKFTAFEAEMIVLRTGKTIEEVNKEAAQRAEKAKTASIDSSVNAWQKIFGARGEGKTETAIKNTQNILLSMIAKGKEAQEKAKKVKPVRPVRGKR